MEQQYFKIIIFSLWFLFPLLPAYILYKFLPNNIVVKGPFKGLAIDMAGSFAAYFILFITSFYIVKELIFEKKPEYEVWTVKGNVFDERGRRVDINGHKPEIAILPTAEIRNGIFDFQIPVKVDKNAYDFPLISIAANSLDSNKQPLTVSSELNNDFYELDVVKGNENGSWAYEFDRKVVRYQKPIKLIKAFEDSSYFVKVTRSESNYIEIDSVNNH